MNNTILTVLSLSASGTVLVLLLLALRPLLKNKVSKAFQYYIWLLVLLRLALPLSFSGSIANQIVSQTVPPQAPVVSSANDNKGTPTQGDIVAQGNGQTAAQGITSAETAPHGIGVSNPGAQASEPTHLHIWRLVLEHQTAIWLLGALIHFGWFIITYLRFSRKIRGTSVRPHPMDREVFVNLRGNANVQLVCSPYIDTPMLIGVLSPCIVIPHLAFVVNGMKPELQHILRHELTITAAAICCTNGLSYS